MTDTDWIKRLQEDGDEIDNEIEDEVETKPSNITQHTLLSYITGNDDLWGLIDPIIKPEYFDDEYRHVVQLLKDHSIEYKQIPSHAIIRMKTGVMLEKLDDATDERTVQWILDEIQTFCRHRATEIEIRRASESIRKDSSRATLEQIFQNFKNITEISLEKDLGIEVHSQARSLLHEKTNEIIKPTGWKHFDLVVGKGLPCPGLVLLAGTSGLGKSVTLANFAMNYCEQGEFVVYISLELPEKRIFDRLCAMMTDTAIWKIYNDPDHLADQMELRSTSGDGILVVKKMRMSGTTVSHIHSYLKELTIKMGRQPKVGIFDYLDLMHPRTPIRDLGNIHVKDKYCAEELYALCEEWDMLGLTASQMVKNNSEMEAFDHAAVAGGTPKINTMDYVFALSRKEEELVMRVLKGRYGGEGIKLPMHWNINTLRISDVSDDIFYTQCPRFDPKFKRDQAGKDANLKKALVNKEARKVQNENILERIRKISPDIMSGDFDDGDE